MLLLPIWIKTCVYRRLFVIYSWRALTIVSECRNAASFALRHVECDFCKISYLLTPWSRVLLEKLTVDFAASQEIPRIYGTRKSLTVPTSARHLSLSWANSTQSPRPPPTSWRSVLIFSSHLRLGLPNGLAKFLSNAKTEYLLWDVKFA
jgi:hypothetical protein